MSTFHLFPRLPPELRLMIWAATVEPRVVELRTESPGLFGPFKLLMPPTPAILQTCQEARYAGLYSWEVLPKSRYIWLNPDNDTVSLIGHTDLYFFEQTFPSIKRLRIECDSPYMSSGGGPWTLGHLALCEEIYVICLGEMENWHDDARKHPEAYKLENVSFFDANGDQVIGMLDEQSEETNDEQQEEMDAPIELANDEV